MKKLLPILLPLIGLAGGAGAGFVLKPKPAPAPCLDEHGAEAPAAACVDEEALGEPGIESEDPADASEFKKMERQLIVPLVEGGRVSHLMALTLSLEIAPGGTAQVESRMPRIRDALLRALFEHAFSGGFDGDFTAEYVMNDLRRAMLVAARKAGGEEIRNVLVSDIIKQTQ